MKTVIVTVLRTKKDAKDFPPTNLKKFLEWAHDLESKIPKEHQEKATIEFSAYPWYEDDAELNLEVQYIRSETEQERLVREETARREAEAVKRFNERREHQEYLRLKKKFETNN